MCHLVADFPNPECFDQAVRTMLELDVRYLEIQLPFNHSLADGPTIRKANYSALSFGVDIHSVLRRVHAARKEVDSSATKMFLMTYVTPVFDHIHALAGILAEHGFSGAIIPDLPFETLEAQALLHDFHACGLMLVPVVAPTMEPRRLSLFSRTLPPKNLIYAAARTGQTGEKSRIDSRDARAYLDELRRVFPRNPICVGFGIREKSQADFLRERGFIPVIGSAIVETIASSEESGDAGERMQEFFMRM